MQSPLDPATLQTAIRAVYALYHASDTSERKQAETWLGEAQVSEQGWAIGRDLVCSGSAEARFLGATILYRKAATQTAQLADVRPLRDELCMLLIKLGPIDRPGVGPVASQLCQAIAIAALEAAAKGLMPCSSMVSAPTDATVTLFKPATDGAYTTSAGALAVLAALPQEYERWAAEPRVKEVVRADMSANMLPVVLPVVRAMLLSSDHGDEHHRHEHEHGHSHSHSGHGHSHSGDGHAHGGHAHSHQHAEACRHHSKCEAHEKIVEMAVRCISAWMPFGITLSQLCNPPEPTLWFALLHALEHEPLVPHTAECTVRALELNQADAARPVALEQLTAANLSVRSRFRCAMDEGDDDYCHAVAMMLAEVSAEDMSVLAGVGKAELPPSWAQRMELTLDCLQASKRIAEIVLPVFTNLEDLVMGEPPLLNTCPGLTSELFEQCWIKLIQACSYPIDFSDWPTAAIDREEFNRFRRGATEALQAMYNVLGNQAVSVLYTIFSQDSASWVRCEVTMFVLHSIGDLLGTTLVNGRTHKPATDQISQAVHQALAVFLSTSMQVGASQLPPSVATVLNRSIGVTVGSLGKWLNSQPDLLEPTLQLVLKLSGADGDSALLASNSFRQLARECKTQLAKKAIEPLLQELARAEIMNQASETRVAIMEGLSHVLSALPQPHLKPVLESVSSQLMSRLQQLLVMLAQQPNPALLDSCIAEVLSLGALVRFVPSDSGTLSLAAVDAVALSWPTITSLLSSSAVNADVIDAVVEMLDKLLMCAKTHVKKLMPPILETIGPVFQRTLVPSCLLVLARSLEVLGGDEELAQPFGGLLLGVKGTVFSALQSNTDSSKELAIALFDLLHRFALFSPKLLISTATLADAIQLSIACLGSLKDKPTTRALLSFVHCTVGSVDPMLQHASRELLVAQQMGAPLMRGVLLLTIDSLLVDNITKAAQLIRELLVVFTEDAVHWLGQAMTEMPFAPDADALRHAVVSVGGPPELREFCQVFETLAAKWRTALLVSGR